MRVALIGNVNSGKTALFNALTGANGRVGNFPGVTVEKQEAPYKHDASMTIVDLPGIYSLHPFSSGERLTCDYLLDEKPELIINLADVNSLERSLYLTLQLIELQIPMVLALNMSDELVANGGSVDIVKLEEELGIPVEIISTSKQDGIDELMWHVGETGSKHRRPHRIDFCLPGPTHRCIHSIVHLIEDHAQAAELPLRFAATCVVEGDERVLAELNLSQNELETVEHSITEMEDELGLDRFAALADMRYDFVSGVCARVVTKPVESAEYKRSRRIDSVLTNNIAAIPIFIVIMCVIFWLTFSVIGKLLADWLALGISWLGGVTGAALADAAVNPIVQSLVVDGIFAGVGTVVSLVPYIVVLFFFLSILEDTGYTARVAYVLDRLMRRLGLSGRSIVPLLVGFGCTVPAVMATRNLPSERDRRMTVLLTPFMSCSTKIPIYALFAAAFFPRYAALVMGGMYFLGILVGITVAFITNKLFFRGRPVPFVMELPNYRLPSMRSVVHLMWEKAWDFLHRALTVILVATIVIWFLQTFDLRFNPAAGSADSILALLGGFIAPIFAPLGFGTWQAATALITGLGGKEIVVTTFSILTSSSAAALATSVGALFTPVSAISFLVFTLLYTPCVAAIAAIRIELGKRWQALVYVLAQCTIAWVVAFIVYHICLLFV